MDKQTSHRLLNHWAGMHLDGERPSEATYTRFSRTLRDLVPEPEAFAAVNLRGGERALLVLQGDSLFIARANGEDSDIHVHVSQEPLDPAAVSVSTVEHAEGQGVQLDYVRTWTFKRNSEEFLVAKTITSARNIGSEGTVHANTFMRRLCAKVGWAIPDIEE